MVMDHVKRSRKSPITDKIVEFMREHPNTEFSLEQIAMNANVSYKSARNSMSGLRMRGIVVYGTNRGYWKWNENGVPAPPRHNRRPPTTKKAPSPKAESASQNGTTPTAISERDVLEVLRVRVHGELVLMDVNGDFWVARKVDI